MLGLKLITIDATIALGPADVEAAPPPTVRRGRGRGPTPGRGLAEASRFIHEGETALAAARSDGAAPTASRARTAASRAW